MEKIIRELGDPEVRRVINWLAAELKEKVGLETVSITRIQAEDDELPGTDILLARAIIYHIGEKEPKLIEECLTEVSSTRGMLPFVEMEGLFGDLLPLVVLIYFSIEFEYELVTERDANGDKLRKTKIKIKSRRITKSLSNYVEKVISHFKEAKSS